MSTNIKNTDNDEINLVELFETLFSHKLFIFIVTFIFTLCGIGYAMLSTPIYQAQALIQVEKNQNNTLLGDLSSLLSPSQTNSATEIELMKSRMILGKTIDELNL